MSIAVDSKHQRFGSFISKRPKISNGWILYIQEAHFYHHRVLLTHEAQNISGLGLIHPRGPFLSSSGLTHSRGSFWQMLGLTPSRGPFPLSSGLIIFSGHGKNWPQYMMSPQIFPDSRGWKNFAPVWNIETNFSNFPKMENFCPSMVLS